MDMGYSTVGDGPESFNTEPIDGLDDFGCVPTDQKFDASSLIEKVDDLLAVRSASKHARGTR